jgi:tight adherence protein B
MKRLLVAAALAALALPGPAAAAIRLTGLDTSDYPTLRLTVVTSRPVAAAPRLRENGNRVRDVAAKSLGADKALVIAVDRSRSMTGKPLADAVAAAKVFLHAKRPGDPVALVGFASDDAQLTGFTTDADRVAGALDALEASGQPGTALYSAVSDAADSLSQSQLLSRLLIVITDGRNVSTEGSLAGAIDSARAAGVAVYTIGIGSGSQTALRHLSATTGGTYSNAESSAALTGIARKISSQFARTWQLTFDSRTAPGDRARFAVSQQGAGSITRTMLIPASAGRPDRASGVSRLLFHTAFGNLLLALAVGALAALAFAFALSARDVGRIRRRLQPHVPAPERQQEQSSSRRLSMFSSFFAATERGLGRFGAWRGLAQALDRADSPLRPAEFFWIMAGSGLLLALILAVVGLPPLIVLLGLLAGGAVPYVFVAVQGAQRLRAFDDQLADVLMAMGASLRVGHTFTQSMQAVTKDAEDPAKMEFKRVMLETDLGRPPDHALAEMAGRLRSSNFDYVVSVVAIQREVGGSLATLFDMVSETVRQRQQFAKKMRSMTAMGRVSAYVLILLPFFLVVIMSAINYGYMKPLFTTSLGRFLIVVALCGMAIGALILRKIVSFRLS